MVRMRRSDRHAIRDGQTTFPSPGQQTTRMQPSLEGPKLPSAIHTTVAGRHRGWQFRKDIPARQYPQKDHPLYRKRYRRLKIPEAASIPVLARLAAVQILAW